MSDMSEVDKICNENDEPDEPDEPNIEFIPLKAEYVDSDVEFSNLLIQWGMDGSQAHLNGMF